MYKERLKKNFKCSDATMDTLLAGVDIPTIEAEEDAKMELRVIDPPIINGVTLTEHPNAIQRRKYKDILDNGGVVCGLYENDMLILLMPKPNATTIGTTVDDFAENKGAFVKNKVVGRLAAAIDDSFEPAAKGRKGMKLKRPKTLTPDDFWAQLMPQELTAVQASTVQAVEDFVELINGKTTVALKSTPIQDGITTLNVNGLLSPRTFQELTEV